MSQYQLKHRLSTITISAGLSHGRRLKTTAGPQFNTIQQSGHLQKLNGERKSREGKALIPSAKARNHRYSEGDWALKNHRSVNLRRQPNSEDESTPSKAVLHRESKQLGNRIRMKSEYNIVNNKIMIPYIRLPSSQQKSKEELLTSDQYLEQLQREKNRRIQEIYNPQSVAASKVNPNPKSISVLRKNKSKAISINKLGAEQLVESLKKDRSIDNSRERGSTSNSKKTRQSATKNAKSTIEVSSGPKILPVTFQKIEQLSTIKESAESSKKRGSRDQYSNTRMAYQMTHQKLSQQLPTDVLSISSKSKTPNSEHSLPFPKFNQFFENYNKEPQNKTFLFKKLKGVSKDPTSSGQRQSLNESEISSGLKKEKFKELTILKDLDKSMLKVVKGKDGVFYGELDQNEVRNGRGAIFYYNGKTYQGGFKNGEKEGDGVEQHPDGSVYIGQFKNGKRNGKGRFQWSNGQVYDGQWENNYKHGSGLWESKDSLASYIGEWSYGSISGFGVLSNEKGERYEGEFQNFNKEGHGAYRFENGDRLVGSFKRNQPNGECQYFWANDDYYKGDFSNGLRHGRGIIKYGDGSYFEGEFRNDKKCGLGRQQYNDGVVYFGNYENDLRHGYGKLIYEDQIYYEGYWLNNVAVVFQEQSATPDQILEDQKERLASGLSNNFSSNKLKKLGEEDQQKIIKSMRNKAPAPKKEKIQRFSSKNLLERLCGPKARCRCLLKH